MLMPLDFLSAYCTGHALPTTSPRRQHSLKRSSAPFNPFNPFKFFSRLQHHNRSPMKHRLWLLLLPLILSACAQPGLPGQAQRTASTAHAVERVPVLVGTFDTGIFSNLSVSRPQYFLEEEAQTLLVGHLQASQRISVQERARLHGQQKPSASPQSDQSIQKTNTMIVGDIQRWEIVAATASPLTKDMLRGPAPVMHVGVRLFVFPDAASDATLTCQGQGRYALSEAEWRDLNAGHLDDQAVGQKALDLALRHAVQQLVNGLDSGAWRPAHPQSNTAGFSPRS